MRRPGAPGGSCLRQTRGMASLPRGFDVLRTRIRAVRPREVLWLAPYYRLAYPDVATASNARRHFERHGKLEGRSPHPFVDVARLAVQMPDVRLAEVFDTYLKDRARWELSPSPYLDVEAFMRSGPWNGRMHPLVQILRDRPTEPWVRSRLGVIDLASADDPQRIAAGLLALRHPGLIRLSHLQFWSAARGLAEPVGEFGPGRYRVAAGFLIAQGDAEFAEVGSDVVSADGTLVRTPNGVLGVVVGDRMKARTLHVLRSESALEDIPLTADDLVAPATESQVEKLGMAGHRTLPLGRQYEVDVQRVVLR